LSQKQAVFPALLSRVITLGQMRKIGIHFIFYHVALAFLRFGFGTA